MQEGVSLELKKHLSTAFGAALSRQSLHSVPCDKYKPYRRFPALQEGAAMAAAGAEQGAASSYRSKRQRVAEPEPVSLKWSEVYRTVSSSSC